MYIWHKTTGEVRQLDPYRGRVSRMQRRVKTWAATLQDALQHPQWYRLVMVTLTLAPATGCWRPNMIRDYIWKVRRTLKEDVIGYAWTAELQQRGQVHYHVLWLIKRGTNMPYADQAGWWQWGSTRTETARTPFYICKYASKGRFENSAGERPTLPCGLRIFAVWIVSNFTSYQGRWTFKLSILPKWARDLMIDEYPFWKWNRGVGGYDISPPNNTEVKRHITSPWVVVLT